MEIKTARKAIELERKISHIENVLIKYRTFKMFGSAEGDGAYSLFYNGDIEGNNKASEAMLKIINEHLEELRNQLKSL